MLRQMNMDMYLACEPVCNGIAKYMLHLNTHTISTSPFFGIRSFLTIEPLNQLSALAKSSVTEHRIVHYWYYTHYINSFFLDWHEYFPFRNQYLTLLHFGQKQKYLHFFPKTGDTDILYFTNKNDVVGNLSWKLKKTGKKLFVTYNSRLTVS